MEWDWTTFIPTLLATFAGVLLSVILSLVVYKVRNWCRDKGRAKETKQIILAELKANEKTLEKHVGEFRKAKLGLVVVNRLRTSACDTAYHAGRVRLLGGITLQRDLADVIEDWRFYNLMLQRYEDSKIYFILQLEPQRAQALSKDWNDIIMKQAEEYLKKTAELRQKLEAIK